MDVGPGSDPVSGRRLRSPELATDDEPNRVVLAIERLSEVRACLFQREIEPCALYGPSPVVMEGLALGLAGRKEIEVMEVCGKVAESVLVGELE